MQKNEKKTLKGKSVAKSKKNEKIDADIASLIKNQKKTESNPKDSNSKRIDESELEEDLEEDAEMNFGNMEFNQFMQLPKSSDGKSPVLERVAREAPRPIFVGQVSQGARADTKEEDSDDFKYASSNAEKNEPKYMGSSEHIYHESERVDTNQMGRKSESFSSTNQETFFKQSSEAKSTSQNSEKAWRVDRFEVEKAGRKNLLERDEMRYEKYKPSRSK
ncbi:MAG: hypothetical protein AABX91_01440 [Nanoarchaeota archaeon]